MPKNTSLLSPTAIVGLFASKSSSDTIQAFISTLQTSSSTPSTEEPRYKSYPDATFHAYPSLGLDLVYTPIASSSASDNRGLNRVDIYNPIPSSSRASAQPANPPSGRRERGQRPYSSPALPIIFFFPSTSITVTIPETIAKSKTRTTTQTVSRSARFEVTTMTTGREFVSAFGEPTKKGGGVGWVPPWLEWDCVELIEDEQGGASAENEGENGGKKVVVVGVMVELRDPGTGHAMTEEQKKKGMGGLWDQASGWVWANLKIFKPE